MLVLHILDREYASTPLIGRSMLVLHLLDREYASTPHIGQDVC